MRHIGELGGGLLQGGLLHEAGAHDHLGATLHGGLHGVVADVAGISFQEEQSGYLAGYAVVKEGFEKLGFTGGGGGTFMAS